MKVYARALMRNGKLETGMYTRSDMAVTLQLVRQLRGPWERSTEGDPEILTAIIEFDTDTPNRVIILEIIPGTLVYKKEDAL